MISSSNMEMGRYCDDSPVNFVGIWQSANDFRCLDIRIVRIEAYTGHSCAQLTKYSAVPTKDFA
jgi:hypothetical protein